MTIAISIYLFAFFKAHIRKLHKTREIKEIALHVKIDLLQVLNPGQVVLVNLAKAKEKPMNVQLTIVENDPFNRILKCRNERKVEEMCGYESIMEIFDLRKRKMVL